MMLNWVVVGIGDISIKRVIPAVQAEPRSELYGLVTRNRAKGEAYGCKVWTELGDALADAAVDVVYVATPVSLHAPQSMAALAAGKHVLCEKPVGMNRAEAESMVQAGEEAGKTLAIAYYRRLYPKVLRARELVAEGAIGKPLLAEINCGEHFTGAGDWRTSPELAGGGPLYDIGSHRIDLLNYLFGRPVRVTGQISNVLNDTEVEDCATVLIEYENGVRGIVDVRWNSRVPRDGFKILGSKGLLELGPLNGPLLVHPGGTETIPCHENVHYPLIENFASHLIDGVPPAAPAYRAIRTDWVTEQVMEAHADNRYSYLR